MTFSRLARPCKQKSDAVKHRFFSTPSRARTADKLIKSQLLYQLS